MANYDRRATIRALNRPKSKDFRKNPPLIDRRWVFFMPCRLFRRPELRGKIMTGTDEKEGLSREEKFVALAHLYLELQLSLQGAMEAAEADLAHLDGSKLVAEAA
jgi:hypothetical protein